MKLIGITGKLGSGKDFIANNVIIPVVKKSYRFLQCAFADQIKINVMTKKNINYHSIYEQKTPETRILLQQEGTDNARNLNENIWIDYLHNWITVHHNRGGVELFIISDVRFKNEYSYIRNNGGIIVKVVAPTRNKKRLLQESKGCDIVYRKISSHLSECDLDDLEDSKYDMIIKNDPDSNFNLDILRDDFGSLLNTSIENKNIISFRQIDLDQVM